MRIRPSAPACDGFIGELDRAGECGMRDAGDQRHAAALHAEVDDPLAFGKAVVDELAGGAEEADRPERRPAARKSRRSSGAEKSAS